MNVTLRDECRRRELGVGRRWADDTRAKETRRMNDDDDVWESERDDEDAGWDSANDDA